MKENPKRNECGCSFDFDGERAAQTITQSSAGGEHEGCSFRRITRGRLPLAVALLCLVASQTATKAGDVTLDRGSLLVSGFFYSGFTGPGLECYDSDGVPNEGRPFPQNSSLRINKSCSFEYDFNNLREGSETRSGSASAEVQITGLDNPSIRIIHIQGTTTASASGTFIEDWEQPGASATIEAHLYLSFSGVHTFSVNTRNLAFQASPRHYAPTTNFIVKATNGFDLYLHSDEDGALVVLPPGASSSGSDMVTHSATIIVDPISVRLRALEVNQCIQDWRHSVPLIEGKRTFVRAFLEAVDPKDVKQPVTGALLHAVRNGVELTGSPLAPINFDQQAFLVGDATKNVDRTDMQASLNFQIPTEWARGTVTFSVETPGFDLQFAEPAEAGGAAGDGKVTVVFQTATPLKVKFLRVGYTYPPSNGFFFQPSEAEVNEVAALLSARLPVKDVDYEILDFFPQEYRDADGALFYWRPDQNGLSSLLGSLGNLKLDLAAEDELLGLGSKSIYHAVFTGTVPGADEQAAGMALFPPNYVSCSPYGGSLWPEHAVHEVSHALGRPHAVDSSVITNDPFGSGLEGYGGSCGEWASFDADPFPYFFTDARGNVRPGLGPMSQGPDSMIFGITLDSEFGLIALDGTERADIMSYCVNRWPSKFTYEGDLAGLNLMSPPAFKRSPVSAAPKVLQEYMTISGSLDVLSNRVAWLPFRCVSLSQSPPAPSPGPFTMEFQDAAGTVLNAVSFGVSVPQDSQIPVAGFSIVVPENPAIRSVVLKKVATILSERTATANAPMVQWLYPNGGETLNDPTVTLAWQGTDADGDLLSYNIAYSPDNGVTWKPLLANSISNSLTIPVATLRGSTAMRFRVSASDGFHCTVDLSDASSIVPNQSPRIGIVSPRASQAFYWGQPLSFEATVYDPEQGSLALSNVVWRSDRDGLLGTGQTLVRSTKDLELGQHWITASVMDAAGATSTKSNRFVIQPFFAPELRTRDLASNGTLTMSVAGSVPSQLIIEASSNLVDWTTWESREQASLTEILQVTNVSGAPARFFRARSDFLPTRFVAPPESVTTIGGVDVILNAPAVGQFLRYQWYFDGAPIAGATNFSLSLTNIQGNQSGEYFMVASNPGFSLTSAVARVVVYPVDFEILHHFEAGPDGSYPLGQLALGSNGAVYGCTIGDGLDFFGTLFRFDPTTTNYSVLRQFAGADGVVSRGGVMVGSDGQVYGTSSHGGLNGAGTIWRVNSDGSDFTVLRHLGPAPDGGNPEAALIEGSDGRLYGTTASGGSLNRGSVFTIGKDGSNYGALTDFSWNIPSPPSAPSGALTEASDGTLFGVSRYGGENGAGVVFKISKNGTGTALLGSLGANSLPSYPEGSLLLGSNGLLYGTGDNGVLAIGTNGSPFLLVKTLGGIGTTGSMPVAGVIEHADGSLLGTTRQGGSSGNGTVFLVRKDGSGYFTLHNFTPTSGSEPSSPLVRGADGWCYGTTYSGGANNVGVLYRIKIQ